MEGKMAATVATTSNRRLAAYLGAVLSGATGLLYLLIGLGVLIVAEHKTGSPDRARILLGAAVAFFVLTACLSLLDRRVAYVLGAALQVVCIIGYFVIAPSRAPHYEEWGIVIKILQVLLLGTLVYLMMIRRRRPT